MNNLIIAGISGGVDSTVAAFLMKKAGYKVLGVTLVINDNWYRVNNEAVIKTVAELKIDHIFVDISMIFSSKIESIYLNGINQGITPSPCLICNNIIKYQTLYDIMLREKAEFITTGHYINIGDYNKRKLIAKAYDNKKDQSYMLYRLPENFITKLEMPLGILNKTSVRKIAFDNGLSAFRREDSQGLCFMQSDYRSFILENSGESIKSGYFIDKNGKTIGNHNGHQFYTVGQRRGLELNDNKVYFVTAKNPENNTVTLGDYEDLMRSTATLINPAGHLDLIDENIEYTLKPRFSSSGIKGKVRIAGDKLLIYSTSKTPQFCPGQHLVVYDNDFVICGGEIAPF